MSVGKLELYIQDYNISQKDGYKYVQFPEIGAMPTAIARAAAGIIARVAAGENIQVTTCSDIFVFEIKLAIEMFQANFKHTDCTQSAPLVIPERIGINPENVEVFYKGKKMSTLAFDFEDADRINTEQCDRSVDILQIVLRMRLMK